ncbi:MAG: hypothetical protein K0M39_09185 [Rhizobium sp.]|nr:hypothetical protein [Rhizobium sp.]
MAGSNSTQTQPSDRTIDFAFSISTPLYQLHPDATPVDIKTQLSTRLSQLYAMLVTTTGDGFESFDNWSDEIKGNYLWACSMLAKECNELALHI